MTNTKGDKMEQETVQIHSWKWESLNKKLVALNKKAAKLNVPPVQYTVSPEYEVKEKHYSRELERYVDVLVKYVDVTVSTSPVVLEGWSFLASIESTPAGNIIHNIRTDMDVPERYRNATTYCEHCNTDRPRNRLYIVVDKDGNIKQVGSTCIRSYLGIDPTFLVWHATLLGRLREGDPDGWMGGKVDYTIPIDSFLPLALAVAHKEGYVSRKMVFEGRVDEGTPTTADRTNKLYWDKKPQPKEYWWQKEEEIRQDAVNHVEEMEKMVEWVKNADHSNEYMNNLYTIVQAGYVSFKSAGLAASIIPTYRREMEKMVAQERERATVCNEWLGSVGQRQMFKVLVKNVIEHVGDFGMTYITKLVTEQGHQLTWFASRYLEVGIWYEGKATVKKHDEFKGFKQTVITRFSAGRVK
jgi:hypothetical protein